MSAQVPDITPLLRRGLTDSLIADGLPVDEAETFADELVAWAQERGKALRDTRPTSPGEQR